MTQPHDIDGDLVRKLADLLDETKLTEIEYGLGELRIRVTRSPAPVTAYAAAPQAAAAASAAAPGAPAAGGLPENDFGTHPGALKSPMVGTAYLSPSPGSPPFVHVGDAVSVGQVLLIIEAMKVMNQIRAHKAGRVSRILVSDASPVEFGQVVLVID